MLTPDLVKATKRAGKLHLKLLSAEDRRRAGELATAYLEILRRGVGQTREELEEACADVPTTAREKKLSEGIQKLIDDACEYDSVGEVEPKALRGEVFLRASADRKEHQRIDRDAILTEIAPRHSLTRETIERALYSDLRAAQCLVRAPATEAEALVLRYDDAQAQAVLLRATRVTASIRCASPAAYRSLFLELKFRRLLYRIEPRSEGGYRLEIDGPFSLFESVTKYGLQLAMVFPALKAASFLHLVAEIRWGKAREPLEFEYEHERDSDAVEREARLSDDVAALVSGFVALGSGWSVAPSAEVVAIPGLGLCVPDLTFRHQDGRVVELEVMGYWSRDAVWKRVELASSGRLPNVMLFAVSQRLRVSESVLDSDAAALYTYKGVMSPRAVLAKLDGLTKRPRSR